MTNEEQTMKDHEFKLVGNTSPSSIIGKIYVSETTIAQIGIKKVLELVRDLYHSAWESDMEAS